MSDFDHIEIPTEQEFCDGCRKFEDSEGCDPTYKDATFQIEYYWGNHSKMAEAIVNLLLKWNATFYRIASLKFEDLEKCLGKDLEKCLGRNIALLNSFRNRDISELSEKDEQNIRKLFKDFHETLKLNSGKRKGLKSAVSVAKALHLLAPKFFPLWDKDIAKAYKLDYSSDPEEKYIRFCKITKYMYENMKDYKNDSNKNLIKRIDEYNHAKHTQKLIQ